MASQTVDIHVFVNERGELINAMVDDSPWDYDVCLVLHNTDTGQSIAVESGSDVVEIDHGYYGWNLDDEDSTVDEDMIVFTEHLDNGEFSAL